MSHSVMIMTLRQNKWKTQMSPRPQKIARQVKSHIKTMLICLFFNIRGVLHAEFVPPGQTVNQAFYLEVLKRLYNSVRQKIPDLWGTKYCSCGNFSALLFSQKQHDPREALAPYSPDHAPCLFFVPKNEERYMKGHRFDNQEDVKKKKRMKLAKHTDRQI